MYHNILPHQPWKVSEVRGQRSEVHTLNRSLEEGLTSLAGRDAIVVPGRQVRAHGTQPGVSALVPVGLGCLVKESVLDAVQEGTVGLGRADAVAAAAGATIVLGLHSGMDGRLWMYQSQMIRLY